MNDETKTADRNKRLHLALGRHWHEWKQVNEPGVLMFYRCECGEERWSTEDRLNPDYCSPDSPRKLLDEVEAVVVRKFGYAVYGKALLKPVLVHESRANYETEFDRDDLFAQFATTSADDRVTAMIEVLTK